MALDGVTIFGDAPSVADRGGLPALDACGGHVDPSGYYHWHFGAESIQTNLDEAGADVTCSVDQDAEALIGFAYDGYGIYGPEEDRAIPDDLDACSGHVSETAEFGATYHYHLTYDSPNLPTCRVGATADCEADQPRQRRRHAARWWGRRRSRRRRPAGGRLSRVSAGGGPIAPARAGRALRHRLDLGRGGPGVGARHDQRFHRPDPR